MFLEGSDSYLIQKDVVVFVMTHSSQTRIVGKVDGQFLHARW